MREDGASRLQTAMEYLTTYSWAILILVIVLVILFTQNFFSPPQVCTLNENLTCSSYTVSQQGVLQMNIIQTTDSPINITGIGCAQTTQPSIQSVSNGVMNSSTGRTFTVQCFTSTGAAFSGTPSSEFKGAIVVQYRGQYTDYIYTIYGDLETKIS